MSKSSIALIVWMLLLANTPSLARALLQNIQVEAQPTTTTETQLFSHSVFVPYKEVRAPYIYLTTGTFVRIVYNSSQAIDFFCQNSWEYNQSHSTGWHDVAAHWSEQTAKLNRTYTIPTTDTWYFTLVNYNQATGIDIYNITLYQIDTYEIHIASHKANYSTAEQAAFTVEATKNGAPLPGLSVAFQVSDPNGTIVTSQTNMTDTQGQVEITLEMPRLDGQYNATAQAAINGRTIEDSVSFAVNKDTTPPSTTDDYSHDFHTENFTITLTVSDNESGVAETRYRINDGTAQEVNMDGQPEISTESANNTLEYWSLDNAGNEETPHKILTDIKLDKTPPTGLFLINGNTSYVNSTLVTLTVLANDTISGIAQMRFSNDNLTWTPYETYGTSKTWTLEPDDGPRTVYAQFKNNAGLVSITCSATIILDTTPPTIANTSRIPDGNVQQNQPVTIKVNATDTTTGIKSITLAYNLNNSTTWLDLPMILNQTTHLYEYTISGQQENVFIEYRITAYDNAGNHVTTGDSQRYTVIPEFQTLAILLLALASTAVAIITHKNRKTSMLRSQRRNLTGQACS